MIFGLCTLIYAKANLFRKPDKTTLSLDVPRGSEAATTMYFSGPLRAIFDELQTIKARQQLNRLEIKDDFAVMLSSSRQQICDSVGETENRISHNVNSVHERLDDVNNNLIRIDTKVDIKGRK